MDCQEFEANLEGRLDERLAPSSPELRKHAAGCDPCQKRLQQADLLWSGIAAWRSALPRHSADLANRILERALTTDIRRPAADSRHVARSQRSTELSPPQVSPLQVPANHWQGWQGWLVALGSLAAMWLMFVGSSFQDTGRPDRRLSSMGQTRPATVVTQAVVTEAVVTDVAIEKGAPTPSTDLETVLVSAEGAYTQLATQTLEAAQDFALLWPASQSVSNTVVPAAVPDNPATNWNQAWPSELSPIGDSVGEALDFLRRAAPRVDGTKS